MVEGILNIDKPSGITSHDVVRQVRRVAKIRRVGHAGTLDPLATGVLVVCIGRATRLVEYVTGSQKEYLATVYLGQETDSYDAEGELVAEGKVTASRADIEAALVPFRGEIDQVPPMYSAIKRAGQPLYKLARQGIEVAREPRRITIYELELLDWQKPRLALRISCSSGTYIRSLAHDLGRALGCGGHLSQLRRTAVGDFSIEQAVPLGNLQPDGWQKHLLASDQAVQSMPAIHLSLEAARRLSQGQPLTDPTPPVPGRLARVYDANGRFVGIALAKEGFWQARKIWPQEPLL